MSPSRLTAMLANSVHRWSASQLLRMPLNRTTRLKLRQPGHLTVSDRMRMRGGAVHDFTDLCHRAHQDPDA